MPRILDVEQALLLLELKAPFDQRAVQLARRRMAKRWHPDIAPPGRRHEHERHLQAINEAADQLEQLAESSRGGRVSASAVRASAAAARKAREEAGRRAYEAEQRARAAAEDRAKHDPFGSRVPDHSVVHRYARCVSYPEWGVGTVTGIYFSGEGDEVQQWARVMFAVGVRTVPGGIASVRRLLQAGSGRGPGAAVHDRRPARAGRGRRRALAAQRLIYARDADPSNPAVLRLLTAAFWQAGNLPAAARAVRDWARVETDRPTPERFASRIYEDMGAIDLAAEAAARAADRAPQDASAWERLGRLRLRLMDRAGRDRRARAGPAGGADGRRAARSRARLPPRRRCRRRGLGGVRGDAARRRSRPRRGPATPTRSRGPTGSASASRPAAARSRSATTPRSSDLLARVEAARPRGVLEQTAA